MKQYVLRPVTAISFEDLFQFGKESGAVIVGDMPMSFDYQGIPITHENNELYLLPMKNGDTLRFSPDKVLVTSPFKETPFELMDKEEFEALFMPLQQ